MKNYLFHGSIASGIETLHATSKLHGTEDTMVVYLTANPAYALFYIWDAEHNKRTGKYVTCFIKNGKVYYEEQFPDQLKAFYQGVSGYLYCIHHTEDFARVEGWEDMWYSRKEAEIAETRYIPDVYEELLKYEREGKLEVISYEKVATERIRDLYEYMVQKLVDNGIVKQPDCEEAVFYQTYFEPVWRMAKESAEQVGGGE